MSDVILTINAVPYTIKATSFKWSVKNKLIKINMRLSKARQTGANDPVTSVVDTKDITDMITISGRIYGQLINSSFVDAPGVFYSMKNGMTRYPGPFTILHKGIIYSGSLDQIEAEDSANVSQSYRNGSNIKTAGLPNSISITISFTTSTVR